MHIEYQVPLPDHDFVVGSRHKLIPSAIGNMKVVKGKYFTNDVVSYTGNTYIAIRSVKLADSSAFHHLRDLNKVRSFPKLTDSFQIKVPKKR